MTAKELLGIAVALVGYIPYVRDILRNTTKPHAIS